MPEFSPKAVHRFWRDYNDKTIYKVISFMEGVEKWTLDGDTDVEEAIDALGKQLDEIGAYEIGNEDYFIKIGNHLKTGRTLRLLQSIDTANPGSASKLLIHAEEATQNEDDPPGLFLRRNIVFERLRLLSRVFCKERFDLIISALEKEDE